MDVTDPTPSVSTSDISYNSLPVADGEGQARVTPQPADATVPGERQQEEQLEEPVAENLEQPSSVLDFSVPSDTEGSLEDLATILPEEITIDAPQDTLEFGVPLIEDTTDSVGERVPDETPEFMDAVAPAATDDSHKKNAGPVVKQPSAVSDSELPQEGLEPGPLETPIMFEVNAEQLIQVAGGDSVAPADGIEILVRLAQKGEIDPKAVDIIDVTDKFLKLIAAAPKENLRQSGKILFHACVLLRMKAEALLTFSADEPTGDDFMDFEDSDGLIFDSNAQEVGRQITLKDLERAIVRRSQRRQVRKRQVTLDELIAALKEAERIEKIRAEKKPPRAVIELAGQHEVDSVDDLLDLAHDEDVETTIEKVEILLARILKLGEHIELFRLVTLMESHNDWVDAFLASLFLSNAGKIDLHQDEFYGPLFIALCNSSVSNTVVAS